jgi:hypothetical protein
MDGHQRAGSGRHLLMNRSLFWKKSISLDRLYRISTVSNFGDDK